MFGGYKGFAKPFKRCLAVAAAVAVLGQASGAIADGTGSSAMTAAAADDDWIERAATRELDEQERWQAFGAFFASAGQTGDASDAPGTMTLTVRPGALRLTDLSLESLAKDHAWRRVAALSLRETIDEAERDAVPRAALAENWN